MIKQLSQIRILSTGDILALDDSLKVVPEVQFNLFAAMAEAAAKAGYSADGAVVEEVNLPGVRLRLDIAANGWRTEGA